jgi:hypothetical protein
VTNLTPRTVYLVILIQAPVLGVRLVT